MRGWWLVCVVLMPGCASAPQVRVVTQIPSPGPRHYRLPPTFADEDLICEDVDKPGTCATVADVRQFLHSRKG